MHILKLQKFVAMPQTDNNQAFLFVTPPSRISILLLHERTPSFMFWGFLTDYHICCSLVQGLLYLVIALKSTRARKIWAPAASMKHHNFLSHHLQNRNTLKILIFSSEIFETSENWELWARFQISSILDKTSSILGHLYYSKTETTIQRLKGENCEQYNKLCWNYWANW